MSARITPSGRGARRWRRAVAALLCAALLAPAQGCVTKHSFRPDTFDTASNSDIRVYMKERRMVEFDGGSYRSLDSAGTRYLEGSGIDNRPDSLVVKVPFAGRIPFAAIDRIETRKVDVYSTLYVTCFIGFFAVIGFGTDITD